MAIREPEITASGLFDCEGNPLYSLDENSYMVHRQPMDEESIRAWERIGLPSIGGGAPNAFRIEPRDLILWANGEFRTPLTERQMHEIIECFAHKLVIDANRAYYAAKDGAESGGDGGE